MNFQDADLLNPLKKWGCYFVSMANMVERETGVPFTPEKIMRVFAGCLTYGSVDKEATIIKPDHVLLLMGSELRFKSRCDAPAPLTVTGVGEFEILKFSKPGHEHFVLGDGFGKCYADPLPNHDMKPYILVGKRIFSKGGK